MRFIGGTSLSLLGSKHTQEKTKRFKPASFFILSVPNVKVYFWLCHKSFIVTTSQAYGTCTHDGPCVKTSLIGRFTNIRHSNGIYGEQTLWQTNTKINREKLPISEWFVFCPNGLWTVVHCSTLYPKCLIVCSTQTADAIFFLALKMWISISIVLHFSFDRRQRASLRCH